MGMPGQAPAAWWPRATRRPLTLADGGRRVAAEQLAGPFTAAPVGWVLHVVVGDGSPFETFSRSKSPNRRFSHLWVAKDGRVEQYAPLTHKSWAQGDGNAGYWSVETEGMPTEPLTGPQVDALAAWHAWSGTADLVATRPGDRGIGTHYLGGRAWGGHSCPDPEGQEGRGPRSRQRADIIARAVRARQQGGPVAPVAKVDLTVEALQAIGRASADAISSINAVYPPLDEEGARVLPDGRHATSIPDALEELLIGVRALRAEVAEIKASVGR